MSRHAVGTAFIVLLFASAGSAQQVPARSQTPAPAEKPAAAQGQSRPAAPAEAPAPPGQPVNVKLDITISDHAGPGEPSKKAVTMIVADRAAGSIRSIANSVRATLSVDATPQILPNGTIKVLLGLEYNPHRGDGPPTGSSLNQRVSVVLMPGKPLVLSQAADPVSDRKISVEIRGEILK